jgi:protein-disulfide isomerase
MAMKKQVSVVLAVGLLLAGASAASAASMSQSSPGSKMSGPASETLSLTITQQKRAWADLISTASKQNAPSNFHATVGSVVPTTIQIELVLSKAATDVPALKSYDFAVVQDELLIVNPSDKRIVEVITG